MSDPSLMIIAGEISGDIHAGALLAALRRKRPGLRAYGIGGPRMRDAGAETVHDVRDMAVMGFAEVVSRLLFFRRVFREMLAVARERRPDAVVLVDYPGFNLRFAARAHALGIKVIYYICPQVWAWHTSRIDEMAETVDRLITIFPFEAKHFAHTRLTVDYVGHPLVDEALQVRAGPAPDLPWNGEGPRVALLPGSRHHVIDRMLPVFLATAVEAERRHPGASFIIPCPSPELAESLRSRLAAFGEKPAHLEVVEGATRPVLLQAHAAVVASGTATVEAALLGCPMVIAYRMAPLSYLLGRLFVKVDHIGMVNLLAGRRLCPEFIQGAATPAALADALAPLLTDTPARRTMLDGLAEVTAGLGRGGAADRAADIVLREVGGGG